ncbi:MAG: TonB-dependent receptor plug domain-containing protein, partial [Ferruginibacter sp.]
MRKIIYFFMIALLAVSETANAQSREITGRVLTASGTPVPGATVQEKNSRRGTNTDVNGIFKLSTKAGAKIVISNIGFETKEITIADETNLSVTLVQGTSELTTVTVVTALGIRREKKALGYAVSVIDKKQLESRPDGDLGRLLSGKAPGVDILATSGISGSGTNIQIRGANSITGGSDPLFVVDGTPFSGATNQQSSLIYGNQTSSRFLDIDPNNIESISILKGLSATVLYGESGRNGVILITTKNGSGKRTNKKAEVTVTQSYFRTQASSLPDLQNSYGGGFSLTGGFAFFSNWGPKLTSPFQRLPHPYSVGSQSGSFPELADDSIEFRPHDNFKALFKDGHVINTSLNVSAALGSEGSLNANFSHLQDQGFLETNKVERSTFGIGINTKLLNNITVGGTLNYVINNFISPTTAEAGSSGAQSGGAGIFSDIIYTPRTNDLADWPYQTPDGASAYYRASNDIQNPLWTLHNSLTAQKTNRIYGNFTVKYNILKHLDLLYRIGYDSYNEQHILTINKGGVSRNTPPELEYVRGLYRTVSANNRIWDHSVIAQYQTDLGSSFKLDFTGGFNSKEEIYDQTGIKSSEQLVFGLFDHSNFINHDSRAEDGLSDLDFKSDQQSVGVFAQGGLSFNDYVFINLGGRNSWSSTLEKANRSKFYPSGSISFIPTTAFSGLQGNRVLNYLKLRA